MEAINHMPFIVGSYAAGCVIIGALIAWVAIDFRVQRRAIADLEMRGIARRAAPERASAALAEAKE